MFFFNRPIRRKTKSNHPALVNAHFPAMVNAHFPALVNAHFPALGIDCVFLLSSSSDWLIAFFEFVAICQNDYYGFVLRQSFQNLSIRNATNIPDSCNCLSLTSLSLYVKIKIKINMMFLLFLKKPRGDRYFFLVLLKNVLHFQNVKH